MKAPVGSGIPGAEESMLVTEQDREDRLTEANRLLWMGRNLSAEQIEIIVLTAQGLPPLPPSRKK